MEPKPIRYSKDGKRMMVKGDGGAFTWVDAPQAVYPSLTTGQPREAWAPGWLTGERAVAFLVLALAIAFIVLATR